jgi:hypothetical protein
MPDYRPLHHALGRVQLAALRRNKDFKAFVDHPTHTVYSKKGAGKDQHVILNAGQRHRMTVTMDKKGKITHYDVHRLGVVDGRHAWLPHKSFGKSKIAEERASMAGLKTIVERMRERQGSLDETAHHGDLGDGYTMYRLNDMPDHLNMHEVRHGGDTVGHVYTTAHGGAQKGTWHGSHRDYGHVTKGGRDGLYDAATAVKNAHVLKIKNSKGGR